MGKKYEWYKNPLIDMILSFLSSMTKHNKNFDIDVINNYIRNEIIKIIVDICGNSHLKYLEFDLKIDKFADKFEIIPYNFITALWFSGYFPINVKEINDENRFFIKSGGYYSFDYKTNKIIFYNEER